jgi:hypothetical protein
MSPGSVVSFFFIFQRGAAGNSVADLRLSHLRTVLQIALRAVGLCIETDV